MPRVKTSIEDVEFEAIKGFCGFEDTDGNIVIASGGQALELARLHEPFAIYRVVTP